MDIALNFADHQLTRDELVRRARCAASGFLALGASELRPVALVLRDRIISGGVNIYPAEIEGALLSHPKVADCAVFGIPDVEFGESIAAAVQRVDGATVDEAALGEFLRERLAGFKVPRELVFHDTLPRVDNGKIYKRRLREPYWLTAGRQI